MQLRIKTSRDFFFYKAKKSGSEFLIEINILGVMKGMFTHFTHYTSDFSAMVGKGNKKGILMFLLSSSESYDSCSVLINADSVNYHTVFVG